ncbi:unnamed protein product [Blepharisma stoltei]|uniref:Secreted protein n=1 Tax=Blepharisma stoltei TaxID=1481888 RepID=A0AAU9JU53_9CILI|nr:unnamed protein product [Blepharisma stoltei]
MCKLKYIYIYIFIASLGNLGSSCQNREEVLAIIFYYSCNKFFAKSHLFIIWEVKFLMRDVKDERVERVKFKKNSIYTGQAGREYAKTPNFGEILWKRV